MTASIPLAIVLCCAGVSPGGARAQPFVLGQYEIGDPVIQQVCLKKSGKWYGTTFNFSGTWINSPNGVNLKAVMWGNYRLEAQTKRGYANNSITFMTDGKNGPLVVVWYDWFDDYSYQQVLLGNPVAFVKSDCDPPFKGQNTHAATQ